MAHLTEKNQYGGEHSPEVKASQAHAAAIEHNQRIASLEAQVKELLEKK